jgi:hypothetical protein
LKRQRKIRIKARLAALSDKIPIEYFSNKNERGYCICNLPGTFGRVEKKI